MLNYRLLEKLCSIMAPSGNELPLSEFVIQYIRDNSDNWVVKPELFCGEGFQNTVVAVFGTPRVAIFAHLDNVGFTVGYNNQLIPIGSPEFVDAEQLCGYTFDGIYFETKLKLIEDEEFCESEPDLQPGINLSFKPNFLMQKFHIQSAFLDNRVGVFVALELAKTMENGILVFSCCEEHQGGSAEFLSRFVYEKYNVNQALISDLTWVSKGISHKKGAVISLRDRGIPRYEYVQKILKLAQNSGIKYQIEVESSGASDGLAIQRSPYPIDWCFIGAPQSNPHTSKEIVYKQDILQTFLLYQYLIKML